MGAPLVTIEFDGIPPGTDITGWTFSGVTFRTGDAPAPSAPLIVVSGMDTVTRGRGFERQPDPQRNRLFPTSGKNVLSPGGAELVAGPDPTRENDDLALIFDPPVTAVGFDILFQALDTMSYVYIRFLDSDRIEMEWPAMWVPTTSKEGEGAPGGSLFAGLVCERPIGGIVINDADGSPPDCNLGYDTIRVSRPPPVAGDP